MTIQNALTINVEDYFQASAFKRSIKEKDWGLLNPHIEQSINKILQMLSDHDVKATFFVYRWTAQRFPELIKQIAHQGHELAFRYHHENDKSLQKSVVIQELKQGRTLLENLSGHNIVGFRSDTAIFKLESEWLYEQLTLSGYDYRCDDIDKYNVLPCRERYKYLNKHTAEFYDLPVSNYEYLGRHWDIINENTLRIRPYKSTKKLINMHHSNTKEPLVSSVTSWMFDEEQPALRGDSLWLQWLHQYNTSGVPLLFQQLLIEFSWQTLQNTFINKVLPLNAIRNKKNRLTNS